MWRGRTLKASSVRADYLSDCRAGCYDRGLFNRHWYAVVFSVHKESDSKTKGQRQNAYAVFNHVVCEGRRQPTLREHVGVKFWQKFLQLKQIYNVRRSILHEIGR